MKESENENEKENEIINDDNNLKNIEEEEEEIEKIEKIEKIVCPDCGEIPILEIDGKNYIIKSYCPKGHQKQEKLVNYIIQSNQKLQKNIKCDECNQTNEDLKIKIDDMLYCSCGKYVCDNCKDMHLVEEEQEKKKQQKKEEEKEKEEEEQEKEEEEQEHNLIKYSEKDFLCYCCSEPTDYECFCVNCNKNLCCNCLIEHKEENSSHVIIFFSDEIDKFLTDEQINKKKNNFKQQKEKINSFIEELDNWNKILNRKIKNLKMNLKLYIKINEYIISHFNKLNLNEQTIENIKKINFSYDKLIDEFEKYNNHNNNNLINNDDDDNNNQKDDTSFEHQYGYLIGLFNYEKIQNINFVQKEKNKKKKSLKNLNDIKNNQLNAKIDSKITSICQIDKGFALGDESGQIHCYTLDKNNNNNINHKLASTITISDNSGYKINYLCSLKNNHFISSNKNEIKIIKLKEDKDKIQYNIIKNFIYGEDDENPIFENSNIEERNDKLDISKISGIDKRSPTVFENKDNIINNVINEKKNKLPKKENKKNNVKNENKNDLQLQKENKDIKYQIIKLINDNIICIDSNKIMRLEPIFNNNYIKKKPSKDVKSNIISMAEINENKFCIYTQNKKLIIFDSNTFRQKGTEININIENDTFKKIEAVNNDILAGLGRNKIYLISLIKGDIIKNIDTEKTNIDMCISSSKFDKIVIASFSNSNYYLIQYNFTLTKDNLTLSRNDIMNYNNNLINFIYLLYDEEKNNEGKLACVHHNNQITIYYEK